MDRAMLPYAINILVALIAVTFALLSFLAFRNWRDLRQRTLGLASALMAILMCVVWLQGSLPQTIDAFIANQSKPHAASSPCEECPNPEKTPQPGIRINDPTELKELCKELDRLDHEPESNPEKAVVLIPPTPPVEQVVKPPSKASEPKKRPACQDATLLHRNLGSGQLGPEPAGCYVLGCRDGTAVVWHLDGAWVACPLYDKVYREGKCVKSQETDGSTTFASFTGGSWKLSTRCLLN